MECFAFYGSSSLIVTLVQMYQDSAPWVHDITRYTLIAASVSSVPPQILSNLKRIPPFSIKKFQGFGYLAGTEAFILAVYGFYDLCRLHLPKREDTDQLTLTERANQESASSRAPPIRPRRNSGSRHKHISGPCDEPPVTGTVWPIDDIQPCSSKHIQPPNNCNKTSTHHS